MQKCFFRLAVALLPTGVLLSGCGSGSSQPLAPRNSPTPLASAKIDSADARLLARTGLVSNSHMDVEHASGTSLHVFHSVCTGSVDGSCQEVSVFRGNGQRVIWHKHYNGPSKLIPASDGFTVKYEEYRPTDPICCPSGPSTFDTYHWNGSSFTRTTRSEPHS